MWAVRTARRLVLLGAVVTAALGGCSPAPAASGPAAPGPVASTAPVVPTSVSTAAAPTTAAPATTPAPPTPAPPAAAPIVLLDPGHNGRNSQDLAAINKPASDGRGGTKPCNSTGTATNAGYPEHAFTFDVATRVRQKLVAAGVHVVMTRPDDNGVGPCVDVRGRAAARAGAAVAVSIHADGSAAGNSGFHVAYSDPPLNAVQAGPAHVLGTAVRDAMRTGGFRVSDYIGRDGLSPRRDLAGLSLATVPTVLVECANMRNAAEAALVSSAAGRQRYADAIAAGILAFLRTR
ncbi:MAG: N-acetylmuramoyl-L-alanine amidase [Pseudonocardia sp.]|nr:N-acetylmuramoyl-L-alanine amidase [Pseudonocardia sp.]MBN9101141.1 N-acetylmuramoyl-L-alanine amidase [Pseudonocardia sp.]